VLVAENLMLLDSSFLQVQSNNAFSIPTLTPNRFLPTFPEFKLQNFFTADDTLVSGFFECEDDEYLEVKKMLLEVSEEKLIKELIK